MELPMDARKMTKEQAQHLMESLTKTMPSWCSCDELSGWWHVEPYAYCGVCQTNECDNDHYHCTVCTKVTQVG